MEGIFIFALVAFLIIFIMTIAIIINVVKSVKSKTRILRNNIDNLAAGAMLAYTAVKAADQDQMTRPRTLDGTENIYRPEIKKDFPEMNFEVAKSLIRNFLPEYFKALSTGDVSIIRDDCSRQFCDMLVATSDMDKKTYSDVKVHKVVISNYKKDTMEATITFQAAVQYQINNSSRISQEKYVIEYSYYLDYGDEGENVSLRCHHCGAPISSVGVKICPYCDSQIEASIVRTWKITDVKRSVY